MLHQYLSSITARELSIVIFLTEFFLFAFFDVVWKSDGLNGILRVMFASIAFFLLIALTIPMRNSFITVLHILCFFITVFFSTKWKSDGNDKFYKFALAMLALAHVWYFVAPV